MRPGLVFLILSQSVLTGCLSPPPPPELTPGVRAGSGLLLKSEVLSASEPGGVTDIVSWPAHAEKGEMVIVAGTAGVAFLEPSTYRLLRKCRYNDGDAPFLRHWVIDADGDGLPEFFREPGPGAGAALFGTDCLLRWECIAPGGNFPNASCADLDGDGKLEFFLWTGPELRRALILDHDGKDRRSGVAASEIPPLRRPTYDPWHERTRTLHVERESSPYEVSIRELTQQAPWVGYSATRLLLSVVDERNELIHEEVLVSSEGELAKGDGAFAVVPGDADEGDRLLVAYGPDVWEYRVPPRSESRRDSQ